jgi:hypothetical protein
MAYISISPHELKRRRYLELFNELMISIVFFHLLTFTDFNRSDESVFYLGYSFAYCFGIVLAGNIMYIVTNEVERKFRHLRMRQKRKMVQKVMKKRMEAEEANREANEINEERALERDGDPDYLKPKLYKTVGAPAIYGKKIYVKPSGLAPIKEEEEHSQLENDINQEIF